MTNREVKTTVNLSAGDRTPCPLTSVALTVTACGLKETGNGVVKVSSHVSIISNLLPSLGDDLDCTLHLSPSRPADGV